MNRRDRILATINHKEPDRVPIGFDIVGEELKAAVLRHYGVRHVRELHDKAGIDAFSVWDWPAVMPEFIGPRKPHVIEHDSTYGSWGKVVEHVYPMENTTLEAYEWPRVEHFDFSTLNTRLRDVKAQDITTASGHAGFGWLHHVQLRGYENALMDVFEDEWMEEYVARNHSFAVAYFSALFAAADGEIDIIRADDDMGGQDALIISPSTWRKWYKPLWKAVFDICHANGAKVWFHSCGFCRDLLDDFVEMGVDILNPIPPYVRGNDHADLKQRYGHLLAFDGGVDQMNILVQGDPKAVRADVKRCIEILAPGGGYIIGPSHVVTRDVPLPNIIALFEAAKDFGSYRQARLPRIPGK
jgi:uroporphyrinogen decarboxylase